MYNMMVSKQKLEFLDSWENHLEGKLYDFFKRRASYPFKASRNLEICNHFWNLLKICVYLISLIPFFIFFQFNKKTVWTFLKCTLPRRDEDIWETENGIPKGNIWFIIFFVKFLLFCLIRYFVILGLFCQF